MWQGSLNLYHWSFQFVLETFRTEEILSSKNLSLNFIKPIFWSAVQQAYGLKIRM